SQTAQQRRIVTHTGAVLVIPLSYRNTLLGTVTALNRRDEPEFGQEELTLLIAMAGQIAMAINNAQHAQDIARLKEFNENIVQGVGEAILMEDAEGNITFANPAAEMLLGYPATELIGHHWIHFVVEDEIGHIYREISKRIQNRRSRYETVLRHKAGHHIPVIVSTLTLYQGRKATGVLAAFTDITDLKQAEAALRRRTQELELQNAELDAFAQTVAHDLKNPLTTLIGFSEILEKRFNTLSEERRHYSLQSINEISYKMSEIINELLLLASVRKLDKIEQQPLDMAHLVAEAMKQLSYQIEKYQAHITIPKDWPAVCGYAPWVEEIWTNYISNAIKYGGCSEKGLLPYIELGWNQVEKQRTRGAGRNELGSVENKPSFWRFWVRDNGPGISREEQALLFTPFERLHHINIEGHGLGLSIVRRIVERLEGQVGLESEVGQGSLFYFTLPATPFSPDRLK
ncbi:MAG: PAS domain S-box protein, partial [Anaerolineae bacterium]|nr:PAS domain S-box protein [Anaerolineae bacterium]